MELLQLRQKEAGARVTGSRKHCLPALMEILPLIERRNPGQHMSILIAYDRSGAN